MSLSNADTPRLMTGRIISAGLSGPRETTFGELSGSPHEAHLAILESEYMDRVRERATAMAKDLLASAQLEAAQIKEQARQQGLVEGREQAGAEVESRLTAMSDRLATLLEAIHWERVGLYDATCRDHLAILKMALEKTLNIEIDARRQEILGSLITQALERIDSRTVLAVTVNPEDEAMAAELLERAKASHPDIKQFKVKTDPGQNPGGIVMESQGGKVDNTLESRFAGVMEIFAQFEDLANAEAGAGS